MRARRWKMTTQEYELREQSVKEINDLNVVAFLQKILAKAQEWKKGLSNG